MGGLRLGLQGQGKERGEGHEEPDSGARCREGPAVPTPRPPRGAVLSSGLMASGVTTCVTRSVWVHTERSSVPVRKPLLFT